jgi:hypothetical protein
MVEPVRHRQTKGAETDMFDLQPPRHTSTLPWLCEYALAEGQTARDLGEVAVHGHFSGFGGSLCLEVLLMRIPAGRFCSGGRTHVSDDYVLIAAMSG